MAFHYMLELSDGTYIVSLCTATGHYYILSGQHRFAAARKVAEEALKKAKVVPSWAQIFKCSVVKPETTLLQRQVIAGKVQQQQSTVHESALSERVRWLIREVADSKAEAAEAGDTWRPNRTELLRLTYLKTGCKEVTDGTMVCASCCHLLIPGHAVVQLHRTHGAVTVITRTCAYQAMSVPFIVGQLGQGHGTPPRLPP